MFRKISTVALLAGLAPLAQAADNGIYLGAGYAQSDYGLDNPLDADDFDDEDSGFKVIAGWRPLDNFGVELNYIDHGDARLPASACVPLIGVPCPDSATLGAETLSGFAVGYIDFPVIDLFAKAGVTSWQIDGRSGTFGFDDDDLDFAWGAGIQARFGSLGARLEYEQFPIIEDEELGTISLSFTYTFL